MSHSYLTIKNLSQLKNQIKEGAFFEIIEHGNKPECIGQIRKARHIQTNGFYSYEPEHLDSNVSLANRGKGSWFEYGPASCWEFEDTENGTICTSYSPFGNNAMIWKIKLFFV